MPVPGTISPQPSPFVHVTEQAQPASSSTEMCVVAPSRLARNASWNPRSASPSRKPGVRSDWARAITSTSASTVGVSGVRARSASA